MSIYYYIGANKELPLGSRGKKIINNGYNDDTPKKIIKIKNCKLHEGSKPLEEIIDMSKFKENEIVEYETMIDAAGIYIEEVFSTHSKIKKHFKSKYIYQIAPSFGQFWLSQKLFELDDECYLVNKKCVEELFKYIDENLGENEEIEFYSCWDSEEEMPRYKGLDKTININNFQIGDYFELEDKQYIVVNRTS